MVSIKKFNTGDHISLVDGDDSVIAHGVMMDDEPDVEEIFRTTSTSLVHAASRIPSHWCSIAITDVVRGGGRVVVDSGHAFCPAGTHLTAAERTIQALHDDHGESGFVIFHQWVTARQRRMKKKPKGKNQRP